MFLRVYINNFFFLLFDTVKSYPNYNCFKFFQILYYKFFLKNYLFFNHIFKKNILFFIISADHLFLKKFAIPLIFLQKKYLKNKIWGWFLIYNLIKFKTSLWIKYTYLFLKKNKIRIVISAIEKRHYSWLKYLHQKNIILTGVEDSNQTGTIFDLPFYLPETFMEFYIFFVLTIFFKLKKKKIYNFFFYFIILKKHILNMNWIFFKK